MTTYYFGLKSLLLFTAWVVTCRKLVKAGAIDWLLRITKYDGIEEDEDDERH